jgi:hypothetical protein
MYCIRYTSSNVFLWNKELFPPPTTSARVPKVNMNPAAQRSRIVESLYLLKTWNCAGLASRWGLVAAARNGCHQDSK